MTHKRIARLVNRLSRDRTLSEGDAMSIAYRAAQAWSPTAATAALALRRAGFEYAPKTNYGYRRGRWIGYCAPLSYEKAEREARAEGRQFIEDFRREQMKRARRDFTQATEVVAMTRRLMRQLSTKDYAA